MNITSAFIAFSYIVSVWWQYESQASFKCTKYRCGIVYPIHKALSLNIVSIHASDCLAAIWVRIDKTEVNASCYNYHKLPQFVKVLFSSVFFEYGLLHKTKNCFLYTLLWNDPVDQILNLQISAMPTGTGCKPRCLDEIALGLLMNRGNLTASEHHYADFQQILCEI